MYKNQLQELSQRSCFNLPSYTCIREGPDHAPRFKATVNFNGETFESPAFCSTLRQAEHSAAEVALNALANRGPSHSLAARILDETGVYKNLLQEVSQRVGSSLPVYTTFRTGYGHLPVFTCIVELAGVKFTGQPAKNKKQAEKNAAMAAWTSLKQLPQQSESSSTSERGNNNDEQEHIGVARGLQLFLWRAKMAHLQFPILFPTQNPRPAAAGILSTPIKASKILPLLIPSNNNPPVVVPRQPRFIISNNTTMVNKQPPPKIQPTTATTTDNTKETLQPSKFPAVGAAPYIPFHHFRGPRHGIAPPVIIRSSIPVFSSPPVHHNSPAAAPPRQVVVTPPLPPPPPVVVTKAENGTMENNVRLNQDDDNDDDKSKKLLL
ncbi:double-stranded RNA-binding protein 6-like [Impatiens glandulifera]|uniref:double-stranded RNA-binding protein 6-like n=1 Tax=Impatiens glandulifera TaxID=253017 RepID=UPI001FB19022|nr:double-stranded RNA-binding protein 6-like [Impatiens glandulifera]